MDETIYVILKVLFDFAVEVWFSIYSGSRSLNPYLNFEFLNKSISAFANIMYSSRLWCLLWVCHFPIGTLGQVWYLIVLIPDLCTLTYFSNNLLYWFCTWNSPTTATFLLCKMGEGGLR